MEVRFRPCRHEAGISYKLGMQQENGSDPLCAAPGGWMYLLARARFVWHARILRVATAKQPHEREDACASSAFQ